MNIAEMTKRLSAKDMISTDEAAALAGVSRVTINQWIAKGRAIGLTRPQRGYRLPEWQFDSRMWHALTWLSQSLGTTEGWAMLAFLETPHGGLNGFTPRAAIEHGHVGRVRAVAEAEALG